MSIRLAIGCALPYWAKKLVLTEDELNTHHFGMPKDENVQSQDAQEDRAHQEASDRSQDARDKAHLQRQEDWLASNPSDEAITKWQRGEIGF